MITFQVQIRVPSTIASKLQIIAYIIRRKDQIKTGLKGGKRGHYNEQEEVRELKSYALIILYVVVLLTLYIITELILRGVLALGKRCLGPDFRPYYNTLGQSYRIQVVLRGQIERKRNIIKDRRIQRSEHQELCEGR